MSLYQVDIKPRPTFTYGNVEAASHEEAREIAHEQFRLEHLELADTPYAYVVTPLAGTVLYCDRCGEPVDENLALEAHEEVFCPACHEQHRLNCEDCQEQFEYLDR